MSGSKAKRSEFTLDFHSRLFVVWRCGVWWSRRGFRGCGFSGIVGCLERVKESFEGVSIWLLGLGREGRGEREGELL